MQPLWQWIASRWVCFHEVQPENVAPIWEGYCNVVVIEYQSRVVQENVDHVDGETVLYEEIHADDHEVNTNADDAACVTADRCDCRHGRGQS